MLVVCYCFVHVIQQNRIYIAQKTLKVAKNNKFCVHQSRFLKVYGSYLCLFVNKEVKKSSKTFFFFLECVLSRDYIYKSFITTYRRNKYAVYLKELIGFSRIRYQKPGLWFWKCKREIDNILKFSLQEKLMDTRCHKCML